MKIKKCHVIEYDHDEIETIDLLIRKKKNQLKEEEYWITRSKIESNDATFSEKQAEKLKLEIDALVFGKKGIICPENEHIFRLFHDQIYINTESKKQRIKEFSKKFLQLEWD